MAASKAVSNSSDRAIEETFNTLQDEMQAGLKLYWDTATKILDQSSIKVLDAGDDYYSMEKNFFSSMFLYSYFRAGIPESRRIFYVAVNQCLRGMVTGCDNILDDEYKMTLATDLPLKAGKFRSIVDIMVSDRVLFSLLQQEFLLGKLSSNQVLAAAFESLRTLTKSGVQEASEEQGAGAVLNPDYILSDIHSLKTGILFQSPWALPEMLENLNTGDRKINDSDTTLSSAVLNGALFDIGMGCQIFDDMVDLSLDMKMDRHNYVASLIQYGTNEDETLLFEKIVKDRNTIEISEDFLFQFPAACRTAALKACDLLKRGAKNLFSLEHQFMVDVSILMISKRIGADRFLSDIEI